MGKKASQKSDGLDDEVGAKAENAVSDDLLKRIESIARVQIERIEAAAVRGEFMIDAETTVTLDKLNRIIIDARAEDRRVAKELAGLDAEELERMLKK